jgi:hypothetical protein
MFFEKSHVYCSREVNMIIFLYVHKIFTFAPDKKFTKRFSNIDIYDIISNAIGKKVRKGLFLACFHAKIPSATA